MRNGETNGGGERAHLTVVDGDRCNLCPLGRAAGPGACPFRDVTRRAGTQLLAQGDVPTEVWWVRGGSVLLSAVSDDGEETLCALRGPGSLVGLEAVRGLAVTYDAWALSTVELCRLDRARFASWVGDVSSTPAGAVLGLALDELGRWQRDRIALAGRAVARVARFLVERHASDGGRGPLEVEQQVLARMLGMRAETLSRALARLRADGALARAGVRVVDEAKLRRAAARDE